MYPSSFVAILHSYEFTGPLREKGCSRPPKHADMPLGGFLSPLAAISMLWPLLCPNREASRGIRSCRCAPRCLDSVPTAAQVLRMATSGGAATTAFRGKIGRLEERLGADLVLIDWDKLAHPYLDPDYPVLDAVIQRAKTDGVDMVMCAGELIYADSVFSKMDHKAALEQLRMDLTRALTEEEVERKGLAKQLLPHLQKFYDGYFDPEALQPFYRPSSMV
ncbi:MAG: hypothetical protein CBC34_000080 [Hyphomicrobiaceae bacterium TMED74]|nr:MAG: hypothetical protein CBC34_000080 [Hyphomicrobiaceae bacterium TMED74]